MTCTHNFTSARNITRTGVNHEVSIMRFGSVDDQMCPVCLLHIHACVHISEKIITVLNFVQSALSCVFLVSCKLYTWAPCMHSQIPRRVLKSLSHWFVNLHLSAIAPNYTEDNLIEFMKLINYPSNIWMNFGQDIWIVVTHICCRTTMNVPFWHPAHHNCIRTNVYIYPPQVRLFRLCRLSKGQGSCTDSGGGRNMGWWESRNIKVLW